jgi:hypothetical protein
VAYHAEDMIVLVSMEQMLALVPVQAPETVLACVQPRAAVEAGSEYRGSA